MLDCGEECVTLPLYYGHGEVKRVRMMGTSSLGLPAIPGGRRQVAASQTVQFSGQLGNTTYTGPVTLHFAGAQRKLMSYNTENFYRKKDGGLVKTALEVRALAEVILKEKPDVIALQEVGDKELLEWFNRTYLKNQYPNIVSVPVGGGSGIQVAMMARANMHVVDVRSHWREFSQAAPYQGKRDFLETTFRTDTGYQFTVFNAHCKSMKGGEEKTAPIRMSEARAGARILNRKFTRGKPHLILTGDFNSLHHTQWGKNVLDLFALKKERNADVHLTEVMLKDGKTDPTHSGVDRNGTRRHADSKLDYTFVSKAVLDNVVKAYVAGRFDQTPWRLASDHLPLVTVFEEPDAVPGRRRPGLGVAAQAQAATDSPSGGLPPGGRLDRIA